jgi:hypothetical protein
VDDDGHGASHVVGQLARPAKRHLRAGLHCNSGDLVVVRRDDDLIEHLRRLKLGDRPAQHGYSEKRPDVLPGNTLAATACRDDGQCELAFTRLTHGGAHSPAIR